jgi:hypothetical protein
MLVSTGRVQSCSTTFRFGSIGRAAGSGTRVPSAAEEMKTAMMRTAASALLFVCTLAEAPPVDAVDVALLIPTAV